jgi:hypothetical protein
MTALFWILLYVIGFAATTVGTKYFGFNESDDGDYWVAMFLWPLFVPITLCVLFVTKIVGAGGSWWDKVSDELVEKIKNRKLS